jgi:hypothetical protein
LDTVQLPQNKAQTVGFCKPYELLSCVTTSSVKRGFCKEECAVSVISYGSDILGYVRVVMRGFGKEQCAVSVVSYGSDILG